MSACPAAKPERQLIAEQRELRGRQIAEDRHAVFLERRHHLAHAADARLRVNAGAVAHLGERRKRSTPGAFAKNVNWQ